MGLHVAVVLEKERKDILLIRMSEERYGTYGSRKRGRGGSIGSLFNFVMLAVTVVSALLLVCAYLAKYINPEDAWFFAFAGLGAPIIYVVNIVLMLFWVVQWRLYLLIPLAVLLLTSGDVKLFFRPAKNGEPEAFEGRKMTFVTYNVMGFMKESHDKLEAVLDETAAYINDLKPDVLCMQEFQATMLNPKAKIDTLLGLPYSKVYYIKPNSYGGGWGIAVYSRYPIIASGDIIYPGSNNSSMWVDLRINKDTVRVFNNHLQTTSVNKQDREYIDGQEYLQSEGREEKVRKIAGKLWRGFAKRAEQADSLAIAIGASPHEVIVCGDFNDTPISYSYTTIRGELLDAFVEKGKGMPNTYNGLFNMLRIDHVLHSEGLKALSYDSPEVKYSDHKPVVVTFGL